MDLVSAYFTSSFLYFSILAGVCSGTEYVIVIFQTECLTCTSLPSVTLWPYSILIHLN